MLLPVQSPKLICLGLTVTHFGGCRCMSYSLVLARQRRRAFTLSGLCPGQTASPRIPLLHLRILRTLSGEQCKPVSGWVARIVVGAGAYMCMMLWLLCAASLSLSIAANAPCSSPDLALCHVQVLYCARGYWHQSHTPLHAHRCGRVTGLLQRFRLQCQAGEIWDLFHAALLQCPPHRLGACCPAQVITVIL